MKRFIEGESRTQSTLLSEYLDDYIADTNPERVVDELDLGQLGFDGVDPAATGRPGYHPAAKRGLSREQIPVLVARDRARLCRPSSQTEPRRPSGSP